MSRRVEKPWGYEEIWAETERYVGKLLFIREGNRLSLQHHRVKHETVRVEQGQMILVLEDEHGVLRDIEMRPGDVQEILPGRRHRMVAVQDVALIEVSTPELDDVVRHEDDYGRVPARS